MEFVMRDFVLGSLIWALFVFGLLMLALMQL